MHRDGLFVPSFRALDCPNFIGVSDWLHRQFFITDYIIVLKVHWLTIRLWFLITWYSSNMSCFKIFSLTKFNEYNSRTNRHNISCEKEETHHKSFHGQPIFTSWRGHKHNNSCLQTSVYLQSVLAGRQCEKIQINLASYCYKLLKSRTKLTAGFLLIKSNICLTFMNLIKIVALKFTA